MRNNRKILLFSENYDNFESILGSALLRQFISVLYIQRYIHSSCKLIPKLPYVVGHVI